MAGTSSRTLRLLSLLQTRRYWLGSELADRLSVSLRTLRRDVDRLRELGYPVQADRGVGGGYQLDRGVSLPPLVLDDEEAVAVTVGLLMSARSSITDIAETSTRALAKVIPAMPPPLRRRAESLQSATVSAEAPWASQGIDSETLASAARACRDREHVVFTYTAADGARTERRVEPRQLVTLDRRWYLVAYDLARRGWRSFRLDRMQAMSSTGTRFSPRELPDDDAAAFVRTGVRSRREVMSAELKGSADAVRARIGQWSEVTELGHDRCRVVIHADSPDWAAFAVGASGAHVLSAEPPEFAALLLDWSTRLGGVGPV